MTEEELPTVEQEKASMENEKQEPSASRNDEENTNFPGGTTLALIMLAVYLAVFLVALVSSSSFSYSSLTTSRTELTQTC